MSPWGTSNHNVCSCTWQYNNCSSEQFTVLAACWASHLCPRSKKIGLSKFKRILDWSRRLHILLTSANKIPCGSIWMTIPSNWPSRKSSSRRNLMAHSCRWSFQKMVISSSRFWSVSRNCVTGNTEMWVGLIIRPNFIIIISFSPKKFRFGLFPFQEINSNIFILNIFKISFVCMVNFGRSLYFFSQKSTVFEMFLYVFIQLTLDYYTAKFITRQLLLSLTAMWCSHCALFWILYLPDPGQTWTSGPSTADCTASMQSRRPVYYPASVPPSPRLERHKARSLPANIYLFAWYGMPQHQTVVPSNLDLYPVKTPTQFLEKR